MDTREVAISANVFARLEKLAKGFDTPSSVIERLLNQQDSLARVQLEKDFVRAKTSSIVEVRDPKQNTAIQRQIAATAKTLSTEELERLCTVQASKEAFGITFPLFVRVPLTADFQARSAAVKDGEVKRWSWKHEFNRDGYAYAICTQWLRKHDDRVREWLDRKSAEQS